jgi:hypothetical protein
VLGGEGPAGDGPAPAGLQHAGLLVFTPEKHLRKVQAANISKIQGINAIFVSVYAAEDQ